ncbi:Esa1p-associated factor, partial [Cladochytrium tenue]
MKAQWEPASIEREKVDSNYTALFCPKSPPMSTTVAADTPTPPTVAPSSSSSSSAPRRDLLFTPGERILCFHGPLLYEAKVLKGESWTNRANPAENGPHYFIHYKGWKQTWDEWVPESRTLKYNEENLRRQAELNESMASKKARASSASSSVAVASSDRRASTGSFHADLPPAASSATPPPTASTSRKRGRDSVGGAGGGGGATAAAAAAAAAEEEFLRRTEVRIPVPDALKVLLVDDWENVTKNRRLVRLPRAPSVARILLDYRDAAAKKLKGDRGTARRGPGPHAGSEIKDVADRQGASL